MADVSKVLEALSRKEVMELGRALGVPVTAKLTDPELRAALAQSPRAPLDKILAIMLRDQLKAVCARLGLPTHGKEKQGLGLTCRYYPDLN